MELIYVISTSLADIDFSRQTAWIPIFLVIKNLPVEIKISTFNENLQPPHVKNFMLTV